MTATSPYPPARDAFTRRLYAVHARPLLGYVGRLIDDPDRCEDLLQETLLRAWLHADRGAGDASLRAWLFRVAHNLAVDELRRSQARPVEVTPRPVAAPAGGGDPSDPLLVRLAVTGALARLTPEHRSVLVEVYYRGRTTAEAAHALRIPHGTAKSRLFYGLRQLRSTLHE